MQKETTEGNALIAEFMGFEKRTRFSNVFYSIPYTRGIHKGSLREFQDYDLQFNDSWDWLMPVVEKIETCFENAVIFFIKDSRAYVELDTQASLAYDLPDLPECYSGFCDTKIEAAYSTVLQFIHYHNSLNSK